MTNQTLDLIKAKKKEVKCKIMRFKTFLNNQKNNPDTELIQVKLETLTQQFQSMYTINEDLIKNDSTNEQKYTEELAQIEDDYHEVVANARRIIKAEKEKTQLTLQSTIPPDMQGNSNPTHIVVSTPRLPEITPPKFDGNIENWRSFRDKFLSRIGNNNSISAIDKLTYLQGSLIGKAARAIEAIETTANNYSVAWEILTNKYDNNRKAILRHWSILHNLPKLQKDTPQALDELNDTFRQHLRALKALGEPTEHWNSSIIYLLLSKISESTKYHWETTLPDNKMPSYKVLMKFLERRGSCSEYSTYSKQEHYIRNQTETKNHNKNQFQSRGHVFLNINNNNQKNHSNYYKPNQYQQPNTYYTKQFTADTVNNNQLPSNHYPCPICQDLSHSIYKCRIFHSHTAEQKNQLVKNASLCVNCLGKGHTVNECRGGVCRICEQKHHTFLHLATNNTPNNRSAWQIKTLSTAISNDDIIPTALVNISHQNKSSIECRAIIDTGSTTNFITTELADYLNLPKSKCYKSIGAINQLSTASDYWVTTTIKSRYNNYQRTLDFLVVPQITSLIPDQQIDKQSFNIPPNLPLADPEFYKPAKVSLLISSGVSMSILCVGQIRLSKTDKPDLYLQKTLLGWIIGGTTSNLLDKRSINCHNMLVGTDISKFWELEENPVKKHISQEEKECEEHYRKHVTRNEDGRYIVALPFKDNKHELGESREIAMRRFLAVERKLQKNPDLYQQYRDVINEYIQLGHMIKVNGVVRDGLYLPHHAVIKESSLTTKVRVVFDGSAATSTGVSLNDVLRVGPTLQDDLLTFVLYFRVPKYLITGDIEKMYRQVLIRDEDRKYLLILWRGEDGIISDYMLTTNTFGLGPSAFLAVRTIHQLAEDSAEQYPRAAESLKKRLYIDDWLDGEETIEELIQLRNEVIDLLKSGGFNMRQFVSNCKEVLKGLPECCINKHLQDKNDATLKTLGMYWDSKNDKIFYTVKPINNDKTPTKRRVFSEIAKIFDPLGLVNPVIVPLKLMMQEMWKLNLNWDESLPQDLQTKWNKFINQLPKLNEIIFDRRVLIDQPVNIQLHGFSDASEKAYGACIYVRSINKVGDVHVRLLCAKSRVAPIKKPQTIPKLELCAAALLADLYVTIKTALPINFNQAIFWTDSSIALSWINKSPHLLKTFVANRVADIQDKTNQKEWRHVRTHDNPADLLSRGLLPQEIISMRLWKEGPVWLAGGEVEWPILGTQVDEDIPELKKVICLVSKITDYSILHRYSSYNKLQRIIAYCLRFRTHKNHKGCLTVSELQAASSVILKLVQQFSFPEELHCLQKEEQLLPKSKLLTLHPFLDEEGLIRVGGRLQNSECSYQQKHPIILPKSHYITQLIIEREHINNLHGGTQSTLNTIRSNYWIIDGRNQVRKIIRSCVRCTKVNPLPVNYIIGNLPKVRVTESRAFLHTGIDYCGPFFIKEKRFRNTKNIKVYIAIFICMATKAVHIEVVCDLTSEGFLAALRRFISRRGKCISIHSDNGTIFVGANNELKELYTLLVSEEHNEKVHNYLADKSIQWKFIPPKSPHVGGIWEAAVKSFKHHLKRVVGNEVLAFDQLNTLVIEIVAVLNSRPLTPLSSNPNDFQALTPAHFLIGDTFSGLPNQNFLDTPSNRLSMWQHIQKLKQDFWSRWHKEYINELNIRRKWTRGEHAFKEGSIVLIRDDNIPPLQWRLGRIIDTYPGTDGIVRTVRIQTATGQYERNVKRLALLPVNCEEEDDQAKED